LNIDQPLGYRVVWQLRVLCWNLGDGESLVIELSEKPLPEDPVTLMAVISKQKPELRPIQASVVKGVIAIDFYGNHLPSNCLNPEQEAWLCEISRELLLPII
jgi:hypothetical protein